MLMLNIDLDIRRIPSITFLVKTIQLSVSEKGLQDTDLY